MSLATKDFIKTIIDSGADASMNLFTITFRPLGLKGNLTEVENAFSCRITNIANLLQRDNTTVDISYQNVTIPKISSGSALPKKLSFTIRLDDSYYVWDNIRQLQSIDSFGNITEDESKKLRIIVTAYKPASSSSNYSRVNNANGLENFYSQYVWTFNDCYITSVSPISYGYDSTNVGTTTVGFIWKTYEENRIDEQGSRENILYEQEKEELQKLAQSKSSSATNTSNNQNLVDLNIGKSSVRLGYNYSTNSIGSRTYNNTTFLNNVNTFTGNASSNENITDYSVALKSKTNDMNSEFSQKAIGNSSSAKSFSIQESMPFTNISLVNKSATEVKYSDRDASSSNTYINALQKAESIGTSSQLKISKSISKVLGDANIKTDTICEENIFKV